MNTRIGSSIMLCGAFCLAGLWGCGGQSPPPEHLYARTLDGNVFETAPIRGDFRPLRYRRSGFEYRCTECHEDFTSPPKQTELPGEHSAINAAFNHGLNTNCLSCHNNADRDNYINHDGDSIPSSEPARLCAKCHGPTYRDWERGIHGRQNGHWDLNAGPRTKLLCIQCHDPHAPAFPLMTPEPPPEHSRLARSPETDDGRDTH